MDLPTALTALQKGIVVLVFTGIAAPAIGLLLKRVAGGPRCASSSSPATNGACAKGWSPSTSRSRPNGSWLIS